MYIKHSDTLCKECIARDNTYSLQALRSELYYYMNKITQILFAKQCIAQENTPLPRCELFSHASHAYMHLHIVYHTIPSQDRSFRNLSQSNCLHTVCMHACIDSQSESKQSFAI